MIGAEGIRPGDSRQIVDTRVVQEKPFPEDLQARFEAIFAGFGNSEAKCVTLLVMQAHNPMSGYELHTEFLEATENIWQSSNQTQLNYCNKSLVPNGLVTRINNNPGTPLENGLRYALTDDGIRLGQPIAAYLIQQSLKLPHTLSEIFGQASRHGKTRPIENRPKILEELYGNSPARSSDLGNLTGLGETGITEPLNRLKALGLIEYSSVNSEKPGQIKFRLSEGADEKPIQTIKRFVSLTNQVAEIMFELGEADALTVSKELEKRFGRQSTKYLRIVNMVLRGLRWQGILVSDFKGAEVMSEARLTEDGKKIVETIIIPVKQALSENGNELLRKWGQIHWQDYSAQAVSRHKEKSGNINKKPQEEWVSDTLRIVQGHSETGIRQMDIEKILGHNPVRSLTTLIKLGDVRKEKDGVIVKYYPVASSN